MQSPPPAYNRTTTPPPQPTAPPLGHAVYRVQVVQVPPGMMLVQPSAPGVLQPTPYLLPQPLYQAMPPYPPQPQLSAPGFAATQWAAMQQPLQLDGQMQQLAPQQQYLGVPPGSGRQPPTYNPAAQLPVQAGAPSRPPPPPYALPTTTATTTPTARPLPTDETTAVPPAAGPPYLPVVKGKLFWTDERLHRLVLLFEAEGHPAVPACQAYARPRDVAQRACQELAKALATVMANGLFDAPEPGRKRHPTIGVLSVCYPKLPDSECVWAMNATNVKECPCKNPQHDARRRFITQDTDFYDTTLAADVRHLLKPMTSEEHWARDFHFLQQAAKRLYSATSRYWHQVGEMVDPIAAILAVGTGTELNNAIEALATAALEIVHGISSLLKALLNPPEDVGWALHLDSKSEVEHSLGVVQGFRRPIAELCEVWKGVLLFAPDAVDEDHRRSIPLPLEACVPAVHAASVSDPGRAAMLLQRSAAFEFVMPLAEAPPLHYPAATVKSAKKDDSCYRLPDQLLETNLTRTKRIDDAFLLCLMAMGYQYALFGGRFKVDRATPVPATQVLCRRFDNPSEWVKVSLQKVVESAPGELLIEAHKLITAWNYELDDVLTTARETAPLQYLQFAHGYYTLHPKKLNADTVASYADWRLRQVMELSRHLGVAVPPVIPLSALGRFAQRLQGEKPRLSPLHEGSSWKFAIQTAELPAGDLLELAEVVFGAEGAAPEAQRILFAAVVARAAFHRRRSERATTA